MSVHIRIIIIQFKTQLCVRTKLHDKQLLEQ